MIIYAGMYTSFESFGNYRQKCYTSIVGNNVLVIRLVIRLVYRCTGPTTSYIMCGYPPDGTVCPMLFLIPALVVFCCEVITSQQHTGVQTTE